MQQNKLGMNNLEFDGSHRIKKKKSQSLISFLHLTQFSDLKSSDRMMF